MTIQFTITIKRLLITVLVIYAVVASLAVVASNQKDHDNADLLQNETTIREYSQRTEVWANGALQWTLWDTDYYVHVDCAFHVVSSNGHTCVSEYDAYSYVPNYLEDIDTYLAG